MFFFCPCFAQHNSFYKKAFMWKANKTNRELWRQKVSFKKLLVKRNFFMVQVETCTYYDWVCKVCMGSSLNTQSCRTLRFDNLICNLFWPKISTVYSQHYNFSNWLINFLVQMYIAVQKFQFLICFPLEIEKKNSKKNPRFEKATKDGFR